ncbi:MAG: hypothetical protein OXD01_11430 [Gammaproteobacteria bacterium]|nr:hypothetical protein [Gammaproteobacteria bacterium]
MEKVLTLIGEADSISVLAHPSRYRFGNSSLRNLVVEFTAAGGDAQESSYANVDPRIQKWIAELERENNLYVST